MRIISIFTFTLLCLCLSCCGAKSQVDKSVITSDQMDLLERFNCEQTVMSYAHSRDEIDWQKNINLFTQDAVILFGDTKLEGHDEIKAALLERGPKQFTRHIIASVSVEKTAEDKLMGTSYSVVYGSNPNKQGPKPLSDKSVEAIISYNDVFDASNGRCLIAERIVTLDMVRKNE